MNKLSVRNKTLLLVGANEVGNFTDAYTLIEENLYVHEAIEIHDFCVWIDKNVGGAGSGNIDRLFKAFKNPNDAELKEFVSKTSEIINRYKR